MNHGTTVKDMRVRHFLRLAAKERGIDATPHFAALMQVGFDDLLTHLRAAGMDDNARLDALVKEQQAIDAQRK